MRLQTLLAIAIILGGWFSIIKGYGKYLRQRQAGSADPRMAGVLEAKRKSYLGYWSTAIGIMSMVILVGAHAPAFLWKPVLLGWSGSLAYAFFWGVRARLREMDVVRPDSMEG
jgi:hypothetical protein